MRAVIQRVRRARVLIQDEIVGAIDQGLLILLGVAHTDTLDEIRWLAEKIVHLRIFNDDDGKMNRSIEDVAGGLLIVSQFTLYGECQKGRRPSFLKAARPEIAIPLYEAFLDEVRGYGLHVACGRFAAEMQVELVNDGPVTLILDSPSA